MLPRINLLVKRVNDLVLKEREVADMLTSSASSKPCSDLRVEQPSAVICVYHQPKPKPSMNFIGNVNGSGGSTPIVRHIEVSLIRVGAGGLNARSVPDVIRRKLVNAHISVAADAIQVDSVCVSRLFWVWMTLCLGDQREGTKLSTTSLLAEMPDKADEDVLYVRRTWFEWVWCLASQTVDRVTK